MWTKRNNGVLLSLFTIVGVALVFIIQDARLATGIFLAVTFLESGGFALVYVLRSRWRLNEVTMSIFWITFTYALVSGHILLSFVWTPDYSWRENIRQFLYLFICIAGFNLFLTMLRAQRESRLEIIHSIDSSQGKVQGVSLKKRG